MESNSNKYATKNANERDHFDGGIKLSVGTGAVGYFNLNFIRCRTPVLYVIFVDGARASLYRRRVTMAI